MFGWLRKKPTPPPAVTPAPGPRSTLGINVPPESLQAQLRSVSRMIRLLDAMAKADRKGDKKRLNELDDELQARRGRLIAIGVRAPYKRAELVELRDDLIARMKAGGR